MTPVGNDGCFFALFVEIILQEGIYCVKKTIRNLTGQGKKVYVFIGSEKVCREFLTLEENEGFTFGDGVKPTEKHSSDVFTVSDDGTISDVGIVGRTAIGSKVKETGDKEIVEVDFERYISGDDDYIRES